ncbi:MAG: CotH kinase family protein [Candidatus Competibacteraceae bacterium]|nr:CotH kinase family protein [Candidatus Competibacteraceae bacterium]
MKKFLIIIIGIALAQTLHAQLLINEYSCANMGHLPDNFGKTPDWIELYNAGGAPVNLSNYYLSDKMTNPLKWQMPSVNLAAGQRIVIFASKRNITAAAPYHTNFKLTQSEGNDVIVLSDNSANIIDQVTIEPTLRNHSRGRISDGSATWGVFSTPNPNAANAGSFAGYTTTPTLDMSPGNYPGPIAVSISSPDPNVTIRYTTNGSEPTAASTAYTVPIAVNSTTVIRARAFSSDPQILPGFIETNTYFINVNHSIPILSVASNNYTQLFGNTMLEIRSSIEYFDANEVFQFESYGEVNGHGNDSWAYPQKGIDFITRDEEGYDDEMQYQIFHTTPRPSYKRLIIKAAASDNYPFQNNPGCHLRDAFIQSYAFKSGLHMDGRRFESCILYINGQYWGLYEIREKASDHDYTKYYYNQDEDEIDILSFWGGMIVRYGSTADWNNLYNYIMTNSMAVQANYDVAASRIDVMSVIDHYIYNTYVVNSDWINWNSMWWRGFGNPGVKWKYIMWDMDNVYDLGENFSGWPTTGYQADPCDLDNIFQNTGPNMGHLDIFNALMDNDGFKNLYITRYADLLNGPLSCNRILAHLDSIINVLTPEMPGQIARWGGSMAGWQNNLDHLRTQIEGRCNVINQGIVDCYDVTGPYPVVVLVEPPGSGNVNFINNLLSTYPWSSTYFSPTQIQMDAIPAVSWNFDYWELSNHTVNPSINASSVSFTFNTGDTIIAHFSQNDSMRIQYRVVPANGGTIVHNGNTLPFYPFNDNVAPGESYSLAAVPSPQYVFDHWGANHHSISPSMTDSSGNFTVFNSDTITAYFTFVPPPPPPYIEPATLYIPNSFTPNDDGINDWFQLYFNDRIIELEISIFDRWGNTLFSSHDIQFQWNGVYNDIPLPLGVYAYRLKYSDEDGNMDQVLYGHITLIR